MGRLLAIWKNISIAKKLYFVVGIMAFLIAGELLTLRFAMKNLSATRAFVGGESLWSKSQKNAVFSLQSYGVTKDEKDYQAFLGYLKIPEGDHRARIELLKPNPDMRIIREGFIQGNIHPDDIEPMVELLRRFSWISYLSKIIEIWTQGDELLFQLIEAGKAYHKAVLSRNHIQSEKILNRIKKINDDLTVLEEDFSYTLGEGSRWLEYMVLFLLAIAVLTVESVGLTLAFLTSRSISRGLNELNEASRRIGKNDFSRIIEVQSNDEIGQLGRAVNAMGQMLQKSYKELEDRVVTRTAELSKMADENAKLYEEAKNAVQMRDEFLSIASHELKTPLTSLYLQLQMLVREMGKLSHNSETKKIETMSNVSLELGKRIVVLLDELLDLTRLRIGKFELHRAPCDLVTIVSNVVNELSNEATKAGSAVTIHSEGHVSGEYDETRIGQVVTNLLSNAIKYGDQKPIEIFIRKESESSVISIRDRGVGIPEDQQALIFERFERGLSRSHIPGLGLGLYIAQQIVKAHGGIIKVESEVGKGSTFTVRI